jgi:hypothetical protein
MASANRGRLLRRDTMKWIYAVVAAVALGACGAPVDTLYDDGDQAAPDCPIASTYQGQAGAPGSVCSNAALDCSPACCECASGVDSYWASECSGGVCTDDGTACTDAFNADGTLCTQ